MARSTPLRPLLRSAVAVVVAVATILAAVAPANAYVLLQRYWRDPEALQLCFDSASRPASNGYPATRPVPSEFRSIFTEAVAAWNRTPTPLLMTFDSSCAGSTHIRLAGFHGGYATQGIAGGYGGCWAYTRDHGGYRAHECIRGTGFAYLNIDNPPSEFFYYLRYAVMHELGHAVGLDHPTDRNCNNTCFGPVMSYGSCPSEWDCVLTPNSDDVNGINARYRSRPSESAGGGGCRRGEDPLARADEPIDLVDPDGSIVPARPSETTGIVDGVDARLAEASAAATETARQTVVMRITEDLTGQGVVDPYAAATGTVQKATGSARETVHLDTEC